MNKEHLTYIFNENYQIYFKKEDKIKSWQKNNTFSKLKKPKILSWWQIFQGHNKERSFYQLFIYYNKTVCRIYLL